MKKDFTHDNYFLNVKFEKYLQKCIIRIDKWSIIEYTNSEAIRREIYHVN